MQLNKNWSVTTTVAVNMLDLEHRVIKNETWVKFQDVVRLVHEINKARLGEGEHT